MTLSGGTSGADAAITLNAPVTANSSVTVLGGAGADTITVNVAGASDIKLDGQGGDDHYIIKLGGLAGGAIHVEDSGLTFGDRLKLLGTAADDDITLMTHGVGSWAGVATLAGATPGIVRFTDTLEFVTLYGNAGADTFEVQPSATAEITVNGGSPSFGDGVPPNQGDTLIFDPLGNLFSIVVNEIHTDGSFQIVRFLDIENVPIEPIGTANTYRLDLNRRESSETQTGYEAVLPDHLYASTGDGGTGYGWVGTAAYGFERAAVSSSFSPLIRDGHWGTDPRVFRVDVPDTNWYLVSVKMGDVAGTRDLMRVRNVDTGQILLPNVTPPTQQVEELNFVVQAIADGGGGRIQLEFSDQGGSDPYWMVSAIEVRPAEILNMGIAPDTGIADGATETAYTGVLATPNALVTVATTLGTILTPDADPRIAGIQVWADGGGNFPFTIRHPSGGGQAVLTFNEVTGARTGISTIDYSLPQTRRFDFNHSGSPTQAPVNAYPPTAGVQEPGGYIGVLPGDTYNSALGYGWLTAVYSLDRGTLSGTTQSALLQDSHWGTWGSGARTFRIDLPAGTYEVTVTMGDTGARDQMAVNVVKGTGTGATGITTAAGQYAHRTFTVSPVDGQVQLQFTTFGSDPYWLVNAIEVRPVVASFSLGVALGGSGSDEADGTTWDTFSQTGLPDGLYTVTATAGTIVTTDADGRYAGTQVLVTGGALSVQLQRPSGAGEVIVSAEHVSGLANASRSQTYTGSVGYRFDMNHGALPLQSDYTPVLASTTYNSALGYGWLTAVYSLNRGTLSGTTQSALLQDSHWGTWGSGARTFRIDLPAGDYEVTVTMGDTGARDQMAVNVVKGTGTGATGITTAAGQYAHRTFTVSPVDGQVQLQFTTFGSDPYWLVNAIEVRPVISTGTFTTAPTSEPANGTLDTFSVTGLTDGDIYTVTTTLGAIVASDGDGRYTGTQVIVSGGQLTFQVQRPSVVGTAVVLAEQVNGATRFEATVDYVAPLTVQGGARLDSAEEEVLTAERLAPIVSEAIGRWTTAGLAGEHAALLESVPWTITDLDAQGYLGLAGPSGIHIDDDGAGYGWFLDTTPWEDGEFVADGGQWAAYAGSPAAGRVDLLTVVMHELGHTLGLADLDAEYPYDLMSEVLGVGTRRLANGSHAALVQGETALAAALAQPLRAAAAPMADPRAWEGVYMMPWQPAEAPQSLATGPSAPLDRVFSDLSDLRWHDSSAALHRAAALAGRTRVETADESLTALAAGVRATQSQRPTLANGELSVRDGLFAALDGSLENLFGDDRFEER